MRWHLMLKIKQHKGLDMARYWKITETKGLAAERDVGQGQQIVKPASQPAPGPSHNPSRMVNGSTGPKPRGGLATWGPLPRLLKVV